MEGAGVHAVATLVALGWDSKTWGFTLSVSATFLCILAALFLIGVALRWWAGGLSFRQFEIDQAEIGVGTHKLKFRPNLSDKQVAYAIWVELSTRKIGLEIDYENDVIADIYNSWFEFFSVTRELIKGIPVSRVHSKSTQAIIKLSIEVLNNGLRPHLTKWQARFRRWYERELSRLDADASHDILYPQQIQANFPHYDDLTRDMQRVNEALIRYRAKMRELVLTE